MKLYQLIWMLLKQWRMWNQPVNVKEFLHGLYALGVRFTGKEFEELQEAELVRRMYLPTKEEVEENQRLAKIGRFEPVPVFKKTEVRKIPRAISDKAEADKRFWNMMQTENPVAIQQNSAFDARLHVDAQINKQFANERLSDEYYRTGQVPELHDIVPLVDRELDAKKARIAPVTPQQDVVVEVQGVEWNRTPTKKAKKKAAKKKVAKRKKR